MSKPKFCMDDSVIVISSDEDSDQLHEIETVKLKSSVENMASSTAMTVTKYPEKKKAKIMLPKKLPTAFASVAPLSKSTARTLHTVSSYEYARMDDEEDLLDIDTFEPPHKLCGNNDEDFEIIATSRVSETAFRISSVPSPSKSKARENLPPTSRVRVESKSKNSQSKAESLQRKLVKDQERKERKEQQEREKALKQAENEVLRNSKPGEAHKFITIVIDAQIPKVEDLTAFLVAAELKHETSSSPIYQNSITFKRELVHQVMGDDLKLRKMSTWEQEDQILVLVEAENFVSNVYVHLHQEGDDANAMVIDDIDMITFVKTIQMTCPEKSVTLIIMGMDKYFKKVKSATQKEFRDRVQNGQQAQKTSRKKSQLPVISIVEFQSCMVELQLQTHITYRLVNNSDQLGKLITHYVKSIADAPFKRQRKELGFDWFATADSAGSVKVEKDGQGLELLWTEQLKLFGKVGDEIAQAIIKLFQNKPV